MPDTLLEKYTEQQKQFFQHNQARLEKLVQEGQKPEVLFITCSDSRIMAEEMLGLSVGDFFVHRNIAACVPPSDQVEIGTTAVLEYAVLILKVKHIVVCGHTDCGGIKAIDSPPNIETFPAINQWLNYIEPARHPIDAHQPNLDATKRHHAIVEQHVRQQLDNLRTYAIVQKAEKQGELTLHGWVKYLDTQTLRALPPKPTPPNS
ncbi:MAG: hypothetical protein CSA11_05240 [Chloroflexi bacterium]|nr:MAG: hypothetical protein CSB13_04165 [Chloroflexota bacterium]PIE81177.1 MAG: hypothetical protein CSA11_05240 [Chloroflexota bacterium]